MIRKFKSWMDKKQFCPTVEDIENKELGKLAKRLKGDSDKETLTNILEWQDRNIIGWSDRWYIFLIFYGFLVLSYVVLTFALPMSQYISFIFGIALIIAAILNMTYLMSILIPFVLYIIFLLLLVVKINPKFAITLSPVLTSLAFLLGGMIAMIVYLVVKYRNFKLQGDSKESKILLDIFRFTLPTEKILKYRLAICKDYAKLTASLLFSIYPNSRVYFFTIPQHTATAIKIDGKYYILDQQLPVLTIDGWLIRWNRRDADVYASELIRNSEGKLVGVDFKYHEKVFLHSGKVVDTDKLAAEVAEMLKIKQISQKEKPDFETLLKNYAIYYEDDDITKRSLMKAIKNKLESELCSNMDKISKIEINQNKSDLIVKVYLRTERGE